jgi:hypothetical protein
MSKTNALAWLALSLIAMAASSCGETKTSESESSFSSESDPFPFSSFSSPSSSSETESGESSKQIDYGKIVIKKSTMVLSLPSWNEASWQGVIDAEIEGGDGGFSGGIFSVSISYSFRNVLTFSAAGTGGGHLDSSDEAQKWAGIRWESGKTVEPEMLPFVSFDSSMYSDKSDSALEEINSLLADNQPLFSFSISN